MGLHRSAEIAMSVTAILFMAALQKAEAGAEGTEEGWMLQVRKEKLSHLHFYFHDTLIGRNASVVTVAAANTTKSSRTGFGVVNVMDDLLTEGPKPTSTVVGRAQGLYTSACQEEVRLLMAVTYVFYGGKFNGSTLSVVGSNAVFNEEREMPIVGGTGVFRLARGYALARTQTFDLKTGNAIVEYNVHVLHY
uniref:Dirigent protein n=1 Tax=Araucaria cunninghamii TaxID=56994 RepID=A0A0D6R197_ARACU